MTAEERRTWEKKGFSQDQVREIEEGLAAGLDVGIYAKKQYLAIQMLQIRLGMQDGLPVEVYARPEYDWFQMEEIRLGLAGGIDISKYARSEISYYKMRQVRKGLQAGIDLSAYLKLDAGILRELRKALIARVNIAKYIKQGYDKDQLRWIRRALVEGVDVDPYLNIEFRGVSIEEILLGLEKGLDVGIYARPEFRWRQMREIRLGLEKRGDVSVYADPYYNWRQMREIRLGMENGIDVSAYSNLMYTAIDMRRIRLRMEESDGAYLPPKRDSAPEEFTDFVITLGEGEMEAYFLPDEGRRFTRQKVMEALRRRGICHGIIEEALKQIVAGSDKPVLIAKATEPTAGKDGWYEFFFRTENTWVPAILSDGSVDYQNSKWFEMVYRGQKIAFYHDAEEGEPGYTVTGKRIQPRKGKEMSILYGKGFTLLPDQKTYVADMDGKIEYRGGRIEITRVLKLEELTIATGKMDFEGSIYVKGNVGSGVHIKASEDIVVDGYIEAATLECDGNVVVGRGMNGAGNGVIRAGKDVKGGFFEAVTIYAGHNIQGNYCMNSNLYAEGRVDINGSGALVGGLTCAVRGLSAFHVGNRAGIATTVKLGFNEVLFRHQRELEDKIWETEKELRIFRNACEDFKRKYPPEVRNAMEMYLKIENAIFTKEQQLKSLSEQKAKVDEMFRQVADVKMVVRDNLYEGVIVQVNGTGYEAKNMQRVTIKKVKGKVGAYTNPKQW